MEFILNENVGMKTPTDRIIHIRAQFSYRGPRGYGKTIFETIESIEMFMKNSDFAFFDGFDVGANFCILTYSIRKL